MVTKLPVIAYVIMRMVRPTLAHFVCAILLLAVQPDTLLAQAQKYEGKQVLTIQPLDPSELHDILPLQTNQPLRMADVRASIERLFATGRYADIQVDAQPYNDGSKDGVIVRFLTKNSWFIGAVTATGRISDPPRAGQLENASALDLGQPFTDTRMQEAAAAQQRLMESNGLFRSQIKPSFTYDNNYQQINIHFDVASGPRAVFTMPVLQGDVKLDSQRILTAHHQRDRLAPLPGRRRNPDTAATDGHIELAAATADVELGAQILDRSIGGVNPEGTLGVVNDAEGRLALGHLHLAPLPGHPHREPRAAAQVDPRAVGQ